jgi:methyl-branched lipid omega-hydroxylase
MVDDLAGKGRCDFVREVAAQLPLEVICIRMGIPESAWAQVGDAADTAYLPTAVEEIVRYATPIAWTRRNVTQDTELSGNTFEAGDRVILFLSSADRDETVFDRPGDFDITRTPSPHLGYGGAGPHFCLGAHLARREIAVLLRELFTRLPGIHATAAPVRRRSSLINGIDHPACAIG